MAWVRTFCTLDAYACLEPQPQRQSWCRASRVKGDGAGGQRKHERQQTLHQGADATCPRKSLSPNSLSWSNHHHLHKTNAFTHHLCEASVV